MNMRGPDNFFSINHYRHVWGTRKSRVIGLNHGAFGEIQDGRQDGGYFYRKCPYPFKKLIKHVFLLVFGSDC